LARRARKYGFIKLEPSRSSGITPPSMGISRRAPDRKSGALEILEGSSWASDQASCQTPGLATAAETATRLRPRGAGRSGTHARLRPSACLLSWEDGDAKGRGGRAGTGGRWLRIWRLSWTFAVITRVRSGGRGRSRMGWRGSTPGRPAALAPDRSGFQPEHRSPGLESLRWPRRRVPTLVRRPDFPPLSLRGRQAARGGAQQAGTPSDGWG
jgi:hypothetical protein